MKYFLCIAAAIFLTAQAADVKSADQKPVKKQSPGTVKCYQCNSQNKDQTDCDSTEGDVLQKYIKPCERVKEGTYKGKDANSCRKVLQSVVSDYSVVRECAYDGDEPIHGRRRTGNKGISLYIYQCFNEDGSDSPCNSASSIGAGILIVAAFASLLSFNRFF